MARTQSSTTQRKTNQGRGGQNLRGGMERGRSGARTGGNASSGGNANAGRSHAQEQGSYYGEEEGMTHDTRTAKVIELVAGSPDSFEDAIRNALEDARETLHNIQGCDVRNFTVKCEDGEIVEYRVNLKLAFGIER